ncbi:MAG TPA: 5'-methylthioadenosine nucleosidase [Planctomycetaceae bacterium]|nr:5'-methylthioadenosine nucleosidase [Planctomycetaceae bacterium]
MAEPSQSQPDAPASDAAHADVGIVCALARELAPLLDRCEKVRKYTGGQFVFRGGRYDQVRVAVVESGMGFARARRATQALLDAHTPRWILACGYSGALRPGINVGDIVVADSIVDTHGQELTVDLHMPTEGQKGLHRGRFVTSDELVRTVVEKQQLAERHNAIAVDMESLAVAQVCRESGKPFLAVRVISDDLSADLPPEVLSVFGSSGTLRVGAIVGSLWKRPSSVKDLWRLREQANFAAGRLATFLDGVLVQLYRANH